MVRRIRAVVHGKVQGVAYRASCVGTAGVLGVVGWVRNRPDGTVELEAEGSHEAIEQLLAWCHVGPPRARVDHVAVEERSPLSRERAFNARWRG